MYTLGLDLCKTWAKELQSYIPGFRYCLCHLPAHGILGKLFNLSEPASSCIKWKHYNRLYRPSRSKWINMYESPVTILVHNTQMFTTFSPAPTTPLFLFFSSPFQPLSWPLHFSKYYPPFQIPFNFLNKAFLDKPSFSVSPSSLSGPILPLHPDIIFLSVCLPSILLLPENRNYPLCISVSPTQASTKCLLHTLTVPLPHHSRIWSSGGIY